ncbi:hypothetical protein MKD34_09110 (plasmid) [Cetobacterium somerae]|uniref:XkdQ/YqbQ family protein n=1 Tax=Cetobacterium somerae TaxID=188913 RepID=UPI001F05184A|nr:hypothetical protein [Cetobacterium somerae]UPO98431.1 hypothetical protein MKD34_09110 [Cetobacterium somerae]
MIEVLLVNTEDKILDITDLVKRGMTLSKSLSEFAWELEFDIVKDSVKIDIGNLVILKLDNKEIFSGVIIKDNKFKAMDYSFYLNQNKETFQFVDVKVEVCIRELVNVLGGEVGTIEGTNTNIDKFYFGTSIGSIIKEIIDNIKALEGKEYDFYYELGKFHFKARDKVRVLSNELKPTTYIKGINKDFEFNALNYIKPPVYSRSMENMKNSIKVYTQKGNNYIQVGESKDDKSIKRYGLLQDVISIKEAEVGVNKNKAENILKLSNKLSENLTVEIPFIAEIINPGRVLKLNYQELDITGIFEVKSVVYTIAAKDMRIMAKMDLERLNYEE